MKAGVLALQGAFREHREVLDALGVEAVEVRVPEHLGGLDALFMPGGESTTIGKLLDTSGLREPLHAALIDGLPAFGTCAGLILLADDVRDAGDVASPPALGVLDCTVLRNAYGRQRESFEARLAVAGLDGGFPGVFIRAPIVERVGEAVEVLAVHDGQPVLLRQGAIWAATFHPELSGDLRLHQRFLTEGAEPELATAPKEKR
ncbi:MAG TPA: pyridoxal 5'-phosphate synthase glutaminase subunit PdxT [Acidimicrobiia bacterium]|nr:pyridoxal 5'-phosphate synthase glutaminase subunit PdxT [Acidimicrobiia bacterium]